MKKILTIAVISIFSSCGNNYKESQRNGLVRVQQYEYDSTTIAIDSVKVGFRGYWHDVHYIKKPFKHSVK